MSAFKVGDRVKILPGVATPFVGMEGTITEVRPHDKGMKTMILHCVVFEHREKRLYYSPELLLLRKAKRGTAQ